MSLVRYLYDVTCQQYDGTYQEWRAEEADRREALLVKQEQRDRLDDARADRSQQRRALRREEQEMKVEKELARGDDRLEREKLRVAALRQDVSEHPERLAQDRKVDAEIHSVSRKLVWKTDATEKDIDLEEVRDKLARVAANVRAERARKANPAGPPATLVTPYLDEKEMQDIARKAFRMIKGSSPARREMKLEEWQEELELEYGPLVAAEVAEIVRDLLDD